MRKAIDQAYRNHPVFQQLARYAEFYESFSMSIFGFATWTKAACNIDSYVYSSMQGTLESISHVLHNGRISDSYALLRRYYDSAIINIYSNLYLQNHFSIENFVVDKIDNWLKGKQQLPRYGGMANYIRSSPRLAKITDLLFSDTTYENIRDRCNDYTHYNLFHNVLCNDNQVYLKGRIAILNSFSKDLENILILHLSYLFFLNDHYMTSSDYVDHLECGMTPPEDSQYLVAPFIQAIFDSVIKKNRMDIAVAIKSNTAMKLE